jgi:hypothetical protein
MMDFVCEFLVSSKANAVDGDVDLTALMSDMHPSKEANGEDEPHERVAAGANLARRFAKLESLRQASR